MPRKPSDLIYGLSDRPPILTTVMLSFQHIFLLSSRFIYPVIIVEAIGGSRALAASMIGLSMIAGGIGSILQVLKRGPVGSGYLNPQGCGAAYITASIEAGKIGGIPLILGMTIIAGLFEGLFSRVVYRLRSFFTAEVTGVVVSMVGFSIVSMAILNFVGLGKADSVSEHSELIVGFVTLIIIISISVWGKGKLRLYSIIIGITAGYITAYTTGVLTSADFKQISDASFISLPDLGNLRWSFDRILILPFLIAALSTSLKITGELMTCQKINDADWKRPDMRSVERGILADAIGTVFAGLTGGMGQGSSSANVGLSIATGATSRMIGYVTGIILILLAFCPKVSSIFVIMPMPVKGAAILYVACYMVVAGIQIMTSRMIDARKTFVIGLSLILGLSVEILPKLYSQMDMAGLPKSFAYILHPVIGSSLAFATISALILNMIFRIGISKRKSMELVPGVDSSEKIFDFMEKQGAAWGAVHEVIRRAISALNEFLECMTGSGIAKGNLNVDVEFDEYNLDINISYEGTLIEFPDKPPSTEELLEDDMAYIKLSAFLMKKRSDSVKSFTKNGTCNVRFHFDH